MEAEACLDTLDLACSAREGKGYPVLFVHGFSHNRFVWEPIANSLAPALKPYLVDLRGHGDSGWSPAGRYAPKDYARDLPRLLDRLALDRVVVVGHSLGGLTAALFAAQSPHRVTGIALVDTGPDLSSVALGRMASDAGSAPSDFESEESYEEWLKGILPMADPQALAAFAPKAVVRRLDGRFELKIDPAVLAPKEHADSWEEISAEIERAFGAIGCPSLLVRGGRSALLSQERAEQLAHERLARGRLVTLDNAGHAVMLEDGPGLGRALEDFALEIVAGHSNQAARVGGAGVAEGTGRSSA
jgi:esterase